MKVPFLCRRAQYELLLRSAEPDSLYVFVADKVSRVTPPNCEFA
jgi:hypothetical protein